MKKILIAAAMALIGTSSSFAQSTGAPAAAQSDMNKPGMSNNSCTQMNSGTTGASKDRIKDGMTQGGASKDGMGQMNKGETSK